VPPSTSQALAAVVLAAALVGSARADEAASGVDAYRARMDKWVETRRVLSAEKADWEAEQETLKATRDLLRQQKEALAAEVEALEQSGTVADDERRELLLERGEQQRARAALEGRLRALEEQVLALAREFPAPLQEKLEPLLVQIPATPEESRVPLGQRLVNVLGALAQADKFNGTATFVAETRAVEEGQKVQVRTLYWGLAQAVFVDARGRSAGIGRPGPDGWEFSLDPALAKDAALLLDIYEGNVDLFQFVELPVDVR
jgi:chromosome segregation ATPase